MIASGQTPVIASDGVLNAAAREQGQPLSPGSLVAIFGTDLAASLARADSTSLSTMSLSDVSVTFGGVPAPLRHVSPVEIQAQVPFDALPGPVDLMVMRGGVASAVQTVQIVAASPGVFSIPAGVGNALAVNPDGTLAAPTGYLTDFPSHPARIGDTLTLQVTGLGAVDSPLSSDRPPNTLLTPNVTIGGQPAQVISSQLSLQSLGLNLVQVVIPDVPPGNAVPIQVEANGIRTSDRITIAVIR